MLRLNDMSPGETFAHGAIAVPNLVACATVPVGWRKRVAWLTRGGRVGQRTCSLKDYYDQIQMIYACH